MNANELYDYLTFQRLLSNRISINIFDSSGWEYFITETNNPKKFRIEPLTGYEVLNTFVNNLSYFPSIKFPVRFANEPG